jgi:hypothetical protein
MPGIGGSTWSGISTEAAITRIRSGSCRLFLVFSFIGMAMFFDDVKSADVLEFKYCQLFQLPQARGN